MTWRLERARNTLVAGVLCLPLVAGPGQAQTEARQKPTFSAEVEQVIVDVVVLDKDGNPVPGLAQEDFTLFEGGQAQSIVSFEGVTLAESGATAATATDKTGYVRPDDRGVKSFVVVFDDTHLTSPEAGLATQAVGAFLDRGLRAGDRVTVAPTARGGWWSATMPAGRDDLKAYLKHLTGRRPLETSKDRLTDYEALRIHRYQDKQVQADVLKRLYDLEVMTHPFDSLDRSDPEQKAFARDMKDTVIGGGIVTARAAAAFKEVDARARTTLETLETVVSALSLERGRKTVVLVSPGFVHDTNQTGFRKVQEAAQRANVVIYFLDTRGLTGTTWTADADIARGVDNRDLGAILDQTRQLAEGSDSVALDSGGFTIRNTNDLAGGLDRIARESSVYYLLGYRPTNTKRDGKFRKIKVKLARQGLALRARKGYYAPKGTPAAEPNSRARLARAVNSLHTLDGISLRASSYVFGYSPGGKASVLLVAEADPKALSFNKKGTRHRARLDSLLHVTSRDSGERVSKRQAIRLRYSDEEHGRLEMSWARILRDLELSPGTYSARLVVQDRASGRMGSIRHRFVVPAVHELRTSTLIFTDTFRPAPEGQLGTPVPIARRHFEPNTNVALFFEVYGAAVPPGAAARVDVGYRVLRDDGSTFSKIDTQPVGVSPEGQPGQLVMIPLKGAEPGRYEMVLDVNDRTSGRTLEVRHPFLVGSPDQLQQAEAAVAAAESNQGGYLDLVERYRKGEPGAVAQLAAWPGATTKALVHSVVESKKKACQGGCLLGAALLHTEAAAGAVSQGRLASGRVHINSAQKLLERAEKDSKGAGDFKDRWLLAVGHLFRGHSQFDTAVGYYDRCTKSRLKARGLLGVGSVYEAAASVPPPPPAPGASPLTHFQRQAMREQAAGKAEKAYRQALEADQSLREARLRLGRILLLRGKNKAALQQLRPLASDQDTYIRGMANLLLGRVEQEQGRLADALLHFRTAVATMQSRRGHLALGQALFLTGLPQEASEHFEAALAAPAEGQLDPWLAYNFGPEQGQGFARLMRELRNGVKP